MEGETNNQENTSERGNTEFDSTLIIIFLGLIGIAFFVMYVATDGFGYNKSLHKSSDAIEKYIDPEDLVGVDREILEIKVDDIGPYFVRADSSQILYTTMSECIDECLERWSTYSALDKVALGQIYTIDREDNREIQYTWKGNPLYTHNFDDPSTAMSDGIGRVRRIARP